jgi:hypothetical protein
MSKKNKVGRAFRRLASAFRAKDERAFDEAMEELEDNIEEQKDEEDPDTIEVHNHIPDTMMDGVGELPPKDPPGFDSRRGRDEEGEMPPWFKKHAEATDARFKSMQDAIENLKKGTEEPDDPGAEEPGSSEDRRDEVEGEPGMQKEPDPNLEMDRRDRRPPTDEANKEILGELEFEAPPGTGDRARKARDSALFADAFQDVLSRAEVLAPGIKVPTFDAKAAPVKTVRTMDRLRRTALDLAYSQPETRGIIDAAMGGRTLDSAKMRVAATRVLFNAVASAAETGNNRRATDRGGAFEAGGGRVTTTGARIQSVSDINKANKERYGRRA